MKYLLDEGFSKYIYLIQGCLLLHHKQIITVYKTQRNSWTGNTKG